MWIAHLEGRRCIRGVLLLALAALVPAAYFLDFVVVERAERESRWGVPRLAVRVAGVPWIHPASPSPPAERSERSTLPTDHSEGSTRSTSPATPAPGNRLPGSSCEGRRPGLPPPPARPSALFEWASARNEQPLVLNEDVFGSLRQSPARHLVVVQVHSRGDYLRALLRSLSLVRGVESVLLVLSHGAVDESLLAAADEVCFCRVLRVFFPYSLQAWPDQFPGPDEHCQSGQDGGKNCHRDDKSARITMAKHHWWWLHNWVFNEIYPLANFSGEALFVEEDVVVSPDALHVLDAMRHTDPAADLLVLSDNSGGIDRDTTALAVRTRWVYNMGLAMGEAAWTKIARCAKLFCTYDDYNYDWSLQKVAEQCVPHRFVVLVMRGARVFHVGKCGGLHIKASADCDSLVLEARATLARAERDGLLFPDAVRAIDKLDWPSVGRPNGGWADARDRQLCLDNANGTLTRVGQASGTAPASEPGSPREGRRRRLRQRPRRH